MTSPAGPSMVTSRMTMIDASDGMSEYDPMTYGDDDLDDHRASSRQHRSQRPPSNFGWAAAALLFFWPLSFTAFTRAGEVGPLWSEGRYDASRKASNSAKTLGQVALGIGLLLALLWVGAIMALSMMAGSLADDAKDSMMEDMGITTSETASSTPFVTPYTTPVPSHKYTTPNYPVPAPRTGVSIPPRPTTPVIPRR